MKEWRRPYYHYKCCTCGFPKPKDWEGLCPRCNPQQKEAYQEPSSRWAVTEWGVVIMRFRDLMEAIRIWLHYRRDRLSQYPITEIELPPTDPKMTAKVKALFEQLRKDNTRER